MPAVRSWSLSPVPEFSPECGRSFQLRILPVPVPIPEGATSEDTDLLQRLPDPTPEA